MEVSARTLAPGTRIDRYEIDSLLGVGGFGAVYRAKHTVLGHAVALKLLHPEHTTSEELLVRFFREAKASAAIGSRHIAHVHDCGTSPEGWHFLAMELLEGRSLEETLGKSYPRKHLAQDRAVIIALQVLESLAAAHAAGIIHRDLKPANIFLTRDPQSGEELVKLLDFGVSKVRVAGAQAPLTQTGATLGTPLYMAPEQFHNSRDVDLRCDLYSAAAVLYESLSGHVPFEAQGYADLVVQICCDSIRPVGQVAPHLSAELEAVVMRGLSRDAEQRWPNAENFAAALCEHHHVTMPASKPALEEPFSCAVEDPTMGPDIDSTRPGLPTAPGVDGIAATMVAEPDQEVSPRSLLAGASSPPPSGASSSPQVAVMPDQFPSVPGVKLEESGTVVIPETVPSAPAVGGQDLARGGSAGRSRRWLFVAVPLALIFGGGLIGGGLLAARHFLWERDTVTATPGPQGSTNPAPSPTPLPNPSPSPAPNPGTTGDDPMGQLITGVLGTVGEGLARQPQTPMEGDPSTGVQLHHPQMMGQLDQSAIEQVLRSAQPGMARCRQPGLAVRVRLQAQINLSQLASIGAAPANQGPLPIVDCVAECFRQTVPQGWAPGQGGVFFFDVELSAR